MDEPPYIPIEYILHCTENLSRSKEVLLGEGRFSQVFKAQDGNQVFVVKVLNDDGMSSFRTEKEVRYAVDFEGVNRFLPSALDL